MHTQVLVMLLIHMAWLVMREFVGDLMAMFVAMLVVVEVMVLGVVLEWCQILIVIVVALMMTLLRVHLVA